MNLRYCKPFKSPRRAYGANEAASTRANTRELRDPSGKLWGYVNVDNGRLLSKSGMPSSVFSKAHATRRALADELGIRASRSTQRMEQKKLEEAEA